MENQNHHGRHDLEKTDVEINQTQYIEVDQPSRWRKLASYGVELRGVQPVAIEERNDKRPINIFSFWFTASLTLLA